MSETTVTVTIDPPSADISESDATVRLSPLSIGDQGQPRSQRTVHFDVPTSPASAISLDSKQYDSDSDAASIRDRAIKIVDYEEGEGSKISTRSGQQGGDPRLSELRPCVECKTLDIHCDGVPCTGCEERGVDCTPSRETFEDALAHVVVHLEARLLELNSLKRTLSSAIFLQQISEELGSNELFRFNFRLHKEKTQLVSYTRKCYYCHPEYVTRSGGKTTAHILSL
ncbi:hypothetical protein CALCODRAFT_25513 [Calocera cornea HHB12733]|uniref:Zn(2)-C6 fungal-type domain-containing protein n=1 Tax=Calocera cornea HHB12733 TaxID=1353952 RepID=A0A165J2L7_9BASI|nr:hypothetical protein CALCODRAFT_25513 [Calocera cornea HHB12733]